MNAVIYARFSSDRQNEASINAQVRACTEYAERHDLTVTGIYADEAISGKESKTAARAQYQKMLRDAHKGLFSVILIHKYDRVARSLAEHVNLEGRLKADNIYVFRSCILLVRGKDARLQEHAQRAHLLSLCML